MIIIDFKIFDIDEIMKTAESCYDEFTCKHIYSYEDMYKTYLFHNQYKHTQDNEDTFVEFMKMVKWKDDIVIF